MSGEKDYLVMALKAARRAAIVRKPHIAGSVAKSGRMRRRRTSARARRRSRIAAEMVFPVSSRKRSSARLREQPIARTMSARSMGEANSASMKASAGRAC